MVCAVLKQLMRKANSPPPQYIQCVQIKIILLRHLTKYNGHKLHTIINYVVINITTKFTLISQKHQMNQNKNYNFTSLYGNS